MSHRLILIGCFTIPKGRAKETVNAGRGESGRVCIPLHKHANGATVLSLEMLPSNPRHTFVLNHGFGGIDERFFELSRWG